MEKAWVLSSPQVPAHRCPQHTPEQPSGTVHPRGGVTLGSLGSGLQPSPAVDLV